MRNELRVWKRKGRRVYLCRFFVDGKPVDRSTGCRDKEAAEAKAREFEREAASPDNARAAKATITDALTHFLASWGELADVGKKSAVTVEFYRKKSGHLLRFFEYRTEDGQSLTTRAPFRLARLRPSHVDAYITMRRGEGVVEHTIDKELKTLKLALKLAIRAGLWTGAVEAVMPVGFTSNYKPRERFLTPEELQRLLCELTPDRAARVAFCIACSANWGESDAALREDVSDVDTIHVRGTKTKYRLRDVPMVTEESRTLMEFCREHAQGVEGRLFQPWGNVNRDIRVACERAKIKRCSPNDLRRTFAHWLLANGATNELLAPCMGHADTRMVERVYGKKTTEELRASLRAQMGLPPMPPKDTPPTGAGTDHGLATNEMDICGHDGLSGHSDAPKPFEISAQGRNRTADTGIFSPPVKVAFLWPAPRKDGRSIDDRRVATTDWPQDGGPALSLVPSLARKVGGQ